MHDTFLIQGESVSTLSMRNDEDGKGRKEAEKIMSEKMKIEGERGERREGEREIDTFTKKVESYRSNPSILTFAKIHKLDQVSVLI